MRRLCAPVSALALLAACGPPPAASTDTTVLVTAFFSPDNGTRTLFFIGRDADGLDVFTRSRRPEVPPAAPLTAPQTARIYLAAAVADRPFTLDVSGIDDLGETVEFGSVEVAPVKNDEVAVTVRLLPLYVDPGDAGLDGGSASDGGFDAGLPDGGTLRCACDGGCCEPGKATCAVPVTVPFQALPVRFFGCGVRGEFCRALCEDFLSDRCRPDGSCGCGSGPACTSGQGLRCVSGQCTCDALSVCPGCCQTSLVGAVCVPPGQRTAAVCGAGGNVCEACNSTGVGDPVSCGGLSPGFCSSSVAGRGCSATCSDTGQCCSGNGCKSATFPTCKNVLGLCTACDVSRTSNCGPNGCRCGASQGQCQPNEWCLPAGNNSYACVPRP